MDNKTYSKLLKYLAKKGVGKKHNITNYLSKIFDDDEDIINFLISLESDKYIRAHWMRNNLDMFSNNYGDNIIAQAEITKDEIEHLDRINSTFLSKLSTAISAISLLIAILSYSNGCEKKHTLDNQNN